MSRKAPKISLLHSVALALAFAASFIACGSEDAGKNPCDPLSTGASAGRGGSSAQAGSAGKSGGSSTGGGSAGKSSGAGGSGGSDAGGSDQSAENAGDGGEAPYVEPNESPDLDELPSEVPTVSLEVDPEALKGLDAAPFDAPDVSGTFTDSSGTRYEGIAVNYRGAYQLQNLIDTGSGLRNWKLKFAKTQEYRRRREWNFNYEPHLRQKLAYDLMKFAGVRVPSARHVLLKVNGQAQGLYLEYEDPDNKDWLSDEFADESGDLYKAATDLPGATPYFATTEYLGDLDSDYFYHYQKKTNNDAKAEDFSLLRAFLAGLNQTDDEHFAAWATQNFHVDRFIAYLVVANFTSDWDGLPQRPKNYWLYEVRKAGHWEFVPWDMDATFYVAKSSLDPMGTDASIFYQLDQYESYQLSENEGTERPLVRRLMKVQAYLEKGYLTARVDKLEALLDQKASDGDRQKLHDADHEIRDFVNQRFDRVSGELSGL
jgi:hypothetical protein